LEFGRPDSFVSDRHRGHPVVISLRHGLAQLGSIGLCFPMGDTCCF
jgi:hypothetical protein